jgi:hypothetical protein
LDSEVKAYEDVTTPAGTFKAFKVVRTTPNEHWVSWWSPDLGIEVKSKFELFRGNRGPGTTEEELVSYDIKE